jgi:lipoprotein-releasing system permease protein
LTFREAVLTLRPVSRLPFELSLALRYLRPKRTFVSVITLISIIGVMLGVAVLMIVIAVMSGFDREWRDKILSANAHMKVVGEGGITPDYEQLMARVARSRFVKGVAPFILTQVMLQTQPADTNENPLISGPVLRGIDPEREAQVSVLASNVYRGAFDVSGRGILMGSTLAHELRVDVGDHVAILSAKTLGQFLKAQKKQGDMPVPDDFTVRGIFNIGFDDFDRMMIVSSLETAQDLQKLDGQAHGLHVMLHDPFRVEEARRDLRRELGPGYDLIAWTEENETIFNALATEKTMMYVILFVVMIVAAFAIVNSEITFAVNKIKEIGLLKALGASNRQVMWIFMGHSIAIGILGVGLGFALGWLVILNLNNILRALSKWVGFDLLPPAIYKISSVPYELLPLDMAIICGGGFLICVLAGLLPAWKASRLQPVEALRNE